MIKSWAQTAEFEIVPPDKLPLQDRDADVWESLITIADTVGGTWPNRARVAAVTLVTASKDIDPSLGIRLLADLRIVFGSRDQMTTKAALGALNSLGEAPWGDLKGKPLDERGLALRLKQYGVKSKTLNMGGDDRAKGYDRTDLHDVWARYLPPSSETSVTPVTSVTEPEMRGEKVTDVTDSIEKVTDAPQKTGNGINGVVDVTDVTHLLGHGGQVCAQCNDGGGLVPRTDDLGELLWLHPECIRFSRSPATNR